MKMTGRHACRIKFLLELKIDNGELIIVRAEQKSGLLRCARNDEVIYGKK